jgi:hypothetical protein
MKLVIKMTEDPSCNCKNSVFSKKLKQMEEQNDPSEVEQLVKVANDEELRRQQNSSQKGCVFKENKV